MKDQELEKKLRQIISLAEECLPVSGPRAHNPRPRSLTKSVQETPNREKVIFSLNSRAFLRRYAKQLSGPKKFVTVVAYLAKGKIGQQVSYESAEKCWKKHKTILSLMANNYGTRAKESGWLDSFGHGAYVLTDKWQEIF